MHSTSKFPVWLFLITFALIFYGLGASFVESFVNYPTWRLIGAGEFLAVAERRHREVLIPGRELGVDLRIDRA